MLSLLKIKSINYRNIYMKIPGPIGSKLNNVESRPLNPTFTRVTKFPLVEYPDEVFQALSSDQKAMVRIATAVCTGKLPDNMEDYALGNMHSARLDMTEFLKMT